MEQINQKSKLRVRLEALSKGQALRVSGINSSTHPDYRKAASTMANIRASTGQKFSAKRGARGLTITRTK